MYPLKRTVTGFGAVQIRFNDFIEKLAMLLWFAGQGAHLELVAGFLERALLRLPAARLRR
jgi:hypothetical protein